MVGGKGAKRRSFQIRGSGGEGGSEELLSQDAVLEQKRAV